MATKRVVDERDCIGVASAIASEVECYDSDDLPEVIWPHLRPLVERIYELEDALTDLRNWTREEYQNNPEIDARVDAVLSKPNFPDDATA